MKGIMRKFCNQIYIRVMKIEKVLLMNHYKAQYTNISIDKSFQFDKYFHLSIHGSKSFLKIEKNVIIKNFCSFLLMGTGKLTISEGVFMNNYCSINCLGEIHIGTNTLLGEGVKIYDHNHKYNDHGKLIKEQGMNIGKIKIGNNCWIGSNTTILNNVEIGDNVIIGANNLIFKSIPSNQTIRSNQSYTSM